METELTVVTLPKGDFASQCAALQKTLAQLPPGATLYVSGPADLPKVIDGVSTSGLTSWHVIAGPVGFEAWTRKERA